MASASGGERLALARRRAQAWHEAERLAARVDEAQGHFAALIAARREAAAGAAAAARGEAAARERRERELEREVARLRGWQDEAERAQAEREALAAQSHGLAAQADEAARVLSAASRLRAGAAAPEEPEAALAAALSELVGAQRLVLYSYDRARNETWFQERRPGARHAVSRLCAAHLAAVCRRTVLSADGLAALPGDCGAESATHMFVPVIFGEAGRGEDVEEARSVAVMGLSGKRAAYSLREQRLAEYFAATFASPLLAEAAQVVAVAQRLAALETVVDFVRAAGEQQQNDQPAQQPLNAEARRTLLESRLTIMFDAERAIVTSGAHSGSPSASQEELRVDTSVIKCKGRGFAVELVRAKRPFDAAELNTVRTVVLPVVQWLTTQERERELDSRSAGREIVRPLSPTWRSALDRLKESTQPAALLETRGARLEPAPGPRASPAASRAPLRLLGKNPRKNAWASTHELESKEEEPVAVAAAGLAAPAAPVAPDAGSNNSPTNFLSSAPLPARQWLDAARELAVAGSQGLEALSACAAGLVSVATTCELAWLCSREAGGRLVLVSQLARGSRDWDAALQGVALPAEAGIEGAALHHAGALLLNDCSHSAVPNAQVARALGLLESGGLHSCVAVALRHPSSGAPSGVLVAANSLRASGFSDDDAVALEVLAAALVGPALWAVQQRVASQRARDESLAQRRAAAAEITSASATADDVRRLERTFAPAGGCGGHGGGDDDDRDGGADNDDDGLLALLCRSRLDGFASREAVAALELERASASELARREAARRSDVSGELAAAKSELTVVQRAAACAAAQVAELSAAREADARRLAKLELERQQQLAAVAAAHAACQAADGELGQLRARIVSLEAEVGEERARCSAQAAALDDRARQAGRDAARIVATEAAAARARHEVECLEQRAGSLAAQSAAFEAAAHKSRGLHQAAEEECVAASRRVADLAASEQQLTNQVAGLEASLAAAHNDLLLQQSEKVVAVQVLQETVSALRREHGDQIAQLLQELDKAHRALIAAKSARKLQPGRGVGAR
jgi:hypothetical protein